MANLAESLIGAGLSFKAAKDQQKAADAAAAKRLNLIKSLDFNPTMTSDLAPTYQRTQSPIARSWIESFLSGNNPDAVSPTSPNASFMKARAQAQQNSMFGTPEERAAQQQQFMQATPWAVTSPKRQIGAAPEEQKKATYYNQFAKPDAAEKAGLTQDLDAAMRAANPKWQDHNTAGQASYLVKKFGSAEAAVDAINRGDPLAMKYVNYIPIGY